MPVRKPIIDLSSIQKIDHDSQRRQAEELALRAAEYAQRRRRQDAAHAFASRVGKIAEAASELNKLEDPSYHFDPATFSGPIVDAFWDVVTAMKEAGLLSELERLDEAEMIRAYYPDADPALSRNGFRFAVRALLSAAEHGRSEKADQELAATCGILAGRWMWYLMLPIVRGLLGGDCRLAWKTTGLAVAPALSDDRLEKALARMAPKKRERNRIWYQWHRSGLTPHKIRDRWNAENPGAPIGKKERGVTIVKTTLRRINRRLSEIV